MSLDDITSSILGEPVTESIYSMAYAYGGRRGWELPGAWFVKALGVLGFSESAVRQGLFRMVRDGAMEARREGRAKWYRLSRYGVAETGIGADKIHCAPAEGWDGLWTFVHYRFTTEERAQRDKVHGMLELEGFAALAPGVYIHPRDKASAMTTAVAEAGLDQRFVAFRGERVGGDSDAELVRRLWDLTALEAGYRRFLGDFEPLLRRKRVPAPRRAFGLRVACVLAYLGTAWDDPDLPAELLPANWPAARARETASTLYGTLLPGTLAFGDEIMRQIGMEDRIDRHESSTETQIQPPGGRVRYRRRKHETSS